MVFDQVDKGTLLFLIPQGGKNRQQLFKLCFLMLKQLMLGLGRIVKYLNKLFEIIGGGINVLEQLWVKILLIIEFSDLVLLIELSKCIIVPIRASKLLEKIPLELASFRLWNVLSLRKVEGKREKLLPV